jgi:hypothetical protein
MSSMQEHFTMKYRLWVGLPLLCLLLATRTMAAGVPPPVVVFDENGFGFVTVGATSFPLDSFFPLQEPTSKISTLAYDITGNAGIAGAIPKVGDVVITEPNVTPLADSDLLRFTNQGLVFVFSDVETSEPLAKADVGVPTPVEPFIRVTETGLLGLPYGEGFNGIEYTPGPTDPGFIPGGITYVFFSDGSVPEPGTVVSMGIGMTIVGLVCWRGRRRKQS